MMFTNNICEPVFKMTNIPNIIIVGDKGVGKSILIKNIISGKKISKNLPILGNEYKFIRINNKLYGKTIVKRIFNYFIYTETTALILANINIPSSIYSIPLWYDKIQKNHKNLHITVVISDNLNFDTSQLENTKIMFDIYYFCSIHNIKLLRI